MVEIETLVQNARDPRRDAEQRHRAFGDLVNHFYEMAYRWAYGFLNDSHLAQDAVQEAFVTAFQKLGQLRRPQAFRGWFKQIVLSQCHRLVRGKQIPTSSYDMTADLIPAPGPGPVAAVEEEELKTRVMEAISALPEKEKIVTQLFYLNGYSQKEIARLLELPLTTVKKRLQYARQNLRGIMVSMMDTFIPAEPQPKPVPIPIPVQRQPGKKQRTILPFDW